jgi:hypothetical protein
LHISYLPDSVSPHKRSVSTLNFFKHCICDFTCSTINIPTWYDADKIECEQFRPKRQLWVFDRVPADNELNIDILKRKNQIIILNFCVWSLLMWMIKIYIWKSIHSLSWYIFDLLKRALSSHYHSPETLKLLHGTLPK